MRTEPLARADKRLVLVAALLAAVSVFYTTRNYSAAMPAASIDLRLSKTEITASWGRSGINAPGLAPRARAYCYGNSGWHRFLV